MSKTAPVTRSIRLDIPYSQRVLKQNPDDEKSPDVPGTPEMVSLRLVIAAVSLKYRGETLMPIPHHRIWKRIQDVLMDDNGKAKTGPLTLSIEQFDWLVQTMGGAQYPPQFAGALVTYLDYLESLRSLGEQKSAPIPEEAPE